MLVHHGKNTYEEASSEAAAHARAKFEALIAGGGKKALEVINQVQTQIPKDRIVKGTSMKFYAHNGLYLNPNNDLNEVMHSNAISQAASRVDVQPSFVTKLLALGEPGKKLLAHNFNELYKLTMKDKQFLTRSVEGQVRAVLSNRFRRLDSRPLLDAFVKAAAEVGAQPIDGFALDTRVSIRAFLPIVFEPIVNEVMVFGLQWNNSDFGAGAHELRAFVLRLWCTNYATMEDALRQVHLGKRLSENFSFSEQTYKLDTEATASAIRDVVLKALAPEVVETYQNAVRYANSQGMSSNEITAYLKKRLTTPEVTAVTEAFNSPDVINLPPGQTQWRLSNALSWVANSLTKAERRLEFQQLAGDLLKVPSSQRQVEEEEVEASLLATAG